MSGTQQPFASALFAKSCAARWRCGLVCLMAGILFVQGTGWGIPKALHACSSVPQENESEPGRSEESSEEECQEEFGLAVSPRLRRSEAFLAQRITRLPAFKSHLVVIQHFASAPVAAEHAGRNGYGGSLRC